MAHSTAPLTITLPITPKARQTAQQFSQGQPNPDKAAQVYFNTLAVLLVNDYLQMLDIPTDLATSYSWNPIGRLCANVADLKIPGIGRLECRPMQANERICHIPPEVWSDRIGYVIVRVNEINREGILLGCVLTVSTTTLLPNQLQPLEILLERLSQPTLNRVHLSQWFDNIFAVGWQTIEEFIDTKKANLSFAFRTHTLHPQTIKSLIEQLYTSESEAQRKIAAARLGNIDEQNPEAIAALVHLLHTTTDEETRWTAAESLWKIDPHHPATGIKRVRDLGMQLAGYPVALMVAILPKTELEIAILLRLYPMGSQPHLPPDVQLILLDELGNLLSVAQARQTDNYIQLKLSGQPGESFGVKVALDEAVIAENFVI